MVAEPTVDASDPDDRGDVQCWCCDITDGPERMVQLGNHPEVNLCLRCAHFVHKQAWEIEDQRKTGSAVFVRDQFRRLRTGVVRRGWHRNRFVGGKLRWLGKYLP